MLKPPKYSLQIILVLGSLLYIFWGIESDKLQAAMSSFGLLPFLFSLTYVFLIFILPAMRLRILVNTGLPFRTAYATEIFGVGMNNILPAKLGEIAKALYLREQGGMTSAEGLVGVFWARFFDLNGILLIGCVASFYSSKGISLLLLSGLVAGVWGMVFINAKWPSWMQRQCRFLPWERVRRLASEVLDQLSFNRSASFYGLMGLFTLAGWGVFSGLFFIVFWPVASLDISVTAILVVFIAASLGVAAPTSPVAIGVYEAIVVVALGWYGVPKEKALVVAIFLHVIQLLPTTLFSLYLLRSSNLSISGLAAGRGRS